MACLTIEAVAARSAAGCANLRWRLRGRDARAAAFGLGDGDRTIATVDADGVALAAIQGLNAKVEAQAAALAERDARIERQAREMADLRDRIAEVESLRGELAVLRSALAGLARGAPALAAAR